MSETGKLERISKRKKKRDEQSKMKKKERYWSGSAKEEVALEWY